LWKVVTALREKEYAEVEDRLVVSEEWLEHEALIAQIRKIDKAEHGKLDEQADQGRAFLHLWLLERLEDDAPWPIGSDDEVLRQYAEAWVGGWRPRKETER